MSISKLNEHIVSQCFKKNVLHKKGNCETFRKSSIVRALLHEISKIKKQCLRILFRLTCLFMKTYITGL